MTDIAKRLFDSISSKYSYGELAKITGIPKSAIQRYATGETEKIPLDRLETLANALGVTTSYLMGWETETPKITKLPAPSLAPDESKLLTLYRRADDIDRKTVMTVLSRYEQAEDPKPPVRMIRHYFVPAAAGYASPIEGEEYEEIELPEDAPAGADFCIEIQGDSMEPYIHDGQRVFVKRGAPLRDFDPGIFFVDGDVFCKQWCPGYAGQVYLLSANPKRKDANITITRDGGRNCTYFGKVLLDKKLPRPMY